MSSNNPDQEVPPADSVFELYYPFDLAPASLELAQILRDVDKVGRGEQRAEERPEQE